MITYTNTYKTLWNMDLYLTNDINIHNNNVKRGLTSDYWYKHTHNNKLNMDLITDIKTHINNANIIMRGQIPIQFQHLR